MDLLPPAKSNWVEPKLDLDYIDQAMTFTPSERCTISCGTVCVDPKASKVLIIYNRRLKIWQLPKGRKNIAEDLHAAALRETYEETGVHASLLPLRVQTRSTKPSGGSQTAHGMPEPPNSAMTYSTLTTSSASSAVDSTAATEAVADHKITGDRLNNEPVGIVNYPDLQAPTPETMKTVFFYAAYADSTLPMGLGAQEEHENLFAEWVEYEVASQRLRFAAETAAMWKVKSDLART